VAVGGPPAVQKTRGGILGLYAARPPGGIFVWRSEGRPPYKNTGRILKMAVGGPPALQGESRRASHLVLQPHEDLQAVVGETDHG